MSNNTSRERVKLRLRGETDYGFTDSQETLKGTSRERLARGSKSEIQEKVTDDVKTKKWGRGLAGQTDEKTPGEEDTISVCKGETKIY